MTILRIVAYLQENPNASYQQIATELGISPRTVRRRISSMPGLPDLKLPSWRLPEVALRTWVGVQERSSVREISSVTGLSRRSVMRGMSVLKKEGLVMVNRRYQETEYQGIGGFDEQPVTTGASVAATAQYFYEQCRSRFPMTPNQTNRKAFMVALTRMRKEHGLTYDDEIAAIDAFFARGVVVGNNKPPLWKQFLATLPNLLPTSAPASAPVFSEPVYVKPAISQQQYDEATKADLALKDSDYNEYMRRWDSGELEVQKLDSAAKQARSGQRMVEQ